MSEAPNVQHSAPLCFNNGNGGVSRADCWVLIIISAHGSAALADAQTVMENQTDASEM